MSATHKNPSAYDLYLRGRALMVNFTETNMREAIGFFEQALALDENYALARAALATSAAWFSVRYAHDTETLSWGERADREAHRALEQDPLLADAHLAIASAAGTLYGGFNWKIVLEKTHQALALDPSLDLAHVARMRVYYHVGAFEQAREEERLARALNPSRNDEIDRLDIAILLFGGKYAQAVQQATSLLQRQTDVPALRQYLGLGTLLHGRRGRRTRDARLAHTRRQARRSRTGHAGLHRGSDRAERPGAHSCRAAS